MPEAPRTSHIHLIRLGLIDLSFGLAKLEVGLSRLVPKSSTQANDFEIIYQMISEIILETIWEIISETIWTNPFVGVHPGSPSEGDQMRPAPP